MNSAPTPARNTKGGNGYKKRKTRRVVVKKSEINIDVERGDGDYAIVLKLLGGPQVRIKLSDGTEVTAMIPGKMRKKRGCWLKENMIILVEKDTGGHCEVAKIIRPTDKDFITAIDKLKGIAPKTSFFSYNDKNDDADNDDDYDDDRKEDDVCDLTLQSIQQVVQTKWTTKKNKEIVNNVSSPDSSSDNDEEVNIKNI